MKRKLFFFLLITLNAGFCQAQFYKSLLPSPEFSDALEKIVLDFRLNFSTIQGAAIEQQEEADTYESLVKLPGAIECVIYQYHSKADTTASWIGVMYKGNNFKEASKVYENVFRLVKKSQVHWIDKSIAGFTGEMTHPVEEVRFTLSALQFSTDDRRYKNFEAEVEMITVPDGWEVHLNLLAKKPDTER